VLPHAPPLHVPVRTVAVIGCELVNVQLLVHVVRLKLAAPTVSDSGVATDIVLVGPKETLNAPPLNVPTVPVASTGLGPPA